MPSSAALAFIRATKASSVPPTSSATATAASLALDTQMARSISSSVKCSPRFQPDLTTAHAGRVLAHRHRGIQGQLPVVDGLKGQKQGHHLGDGRNGHTPVGVLFVQHRAGGLVHQDGRPAGQGQSGPLLRRHQLCPAFLCCCRQRRRAQRQPQQAERRRPPPGPPGAPHSLCVSFQPPCLLPPSVSCVLFDCMQPGGAVMPACLLGRYPLYLRCTRCVQRKDTPCVFVFIPLDAR